MTKTSRWRHEDRKLTEQKTVDQDLPLEAPAFEDRKLTEQKMERLARRLAPTAVTGSRG
jgi:hypothetical protein